MVHKTINNNKASLSVYYLKLLKSILSLMLGAAGLAALAMAACVAAFCLSALWSTARSTRHRMAASEFSRL